MTKGPLLLVRVRLPAVVAKLRNADPFIIGTALIDTGATRTCISKKVAQALALKPVGTIKVGGVGGAKEHALFRVSFEFIQNLQPAIVAGAPQTMQPVIGVANVEVVEADIDAQGLAMLIGRDVLAYSALTYDGPTGAWTLEIPRTQPPGHFIPLGAPQSDPNVAGAVASRLTSRDREKTRAARKASKKARKKNRGK
jgi:predicted aspartyl protease